jgi:hypothetical protein
MALDITGEKARAALRPTRVLHPMLLALCPVLGLFAHNAGRIHFRCLTRLGVAYFLAALTVWRVFWVLLRNRLRAGLVASLVVAAFLVVWGILEDVISQMVPLLADLPAAAFYGAYAVAVVVLLVLLRWWLRGRPGAANRLVATLMGVAAVWFLIATILLSPVYGRRAAWLITGYLILFVALLVAALRYDGDLRRATRSLNWFAGVLVGLYVALYLFTARTGLEPTALPLRTEGAAESRDWPEGSGWPDIYLIVVDGYARSDVLRDVYGYNDLPFQQALKGKGFEFAERGGANYPMATLSLTACLNLDCLHNLVSEEDAEAATMASAVWLYHHNRAFEFLKARGYRLLAFSSGLELLEPQPPVDECLTPERTLREVESVLLDRTVVSRVMQVVYYIRYRNPAYWRFEFRRKRILFAFEELGRIAATPSESPRFVLVTLPVPEPPFLFTRKGERAQPYGEGSLGIDRVFRNSPRELQQAYLDQLHFTSHKVVQTASAILDHATAPPVILIVSSRGATVAPSGPGSREAPASERYAGLMAAHFPAQSDEPDADAEWYDTITLVNVLRVTFNRVLGVSLPLRPDEFYLGAEEHPFQPERHPFANADG